MALYYYCDTTLSQKIKPMAAQLSLKAVLHWMKELRQRLIAIIQDAGMVSASERKGIKNLPHAEMFFFAEVLD